MYNTMHVTVGDVIFFKKINRGSYMSVFTYLLDLLNELRKEIKCKACRAYYLFYATCLIHLIIHEHEYDITITLKSHFWCKRVIIASLCTQRCYGRHNISHISVNHWCFIDFIAWRYFTPRRNGM